MKKMLSELNDIVDGIEVTENTDRGPYEEVLKFLGGDDGDDLQEELELSSLAKKVEGNLYKLMNRVEDFTDEKKAKRVLGDAADSDTHLEYWRMLDSAIEAFWKDVNPSKVRVRLRKI